MTVALFRSWMIAAQQDIEQGRREPKSIVKGKTIKPARVIYATADARIRLAKAKA